MKLKPVAVISNPPTIPSIVSDQYQPQPPVKRPSRLMLALVIAVPLVLIAGGGIFWMTREKKETAPPPKTETAPTSSKSLSRDATLEYDGVYMGRQMYMDAGNTELDLRAIRPIGGIPVDNLKGAARMTEIPDEVLKRWIESLQKVSGESSADVFLLHVVTKSGLGARMTILFDGNKLRPEVSDKLLRRLTSIKRKILKEWQTCLARYPTETKDLQQLSCVAVILLPVDSLYNGDQYNQEQGAKYLRRLKSLPEEAVVRWMKEIDKYGGTQLDAAINIVLLDRFFDADTFSQSKYDKELAKHK